MAHNISHGTHSSMMKDISCNSASQLNAGEQAPVVMHSVSQHVQIDGQMEEWGNITVGGGAKSSAWNPLLCYQHLIVDWGGQVVCVCVCVYIHVSSTSLQTWVDEHCVCVFTCYQHLIMDWGGQTLCVCVCVYMLSAPHYGLGWTSVVCVCIYVISTSLWTGVDEHCVCVYTC